MKGNSEVVKRSQEISNGKVLTLTAVCSPALQCEGGDVINIYYDNASQKSTQAVFKFKPTAKSDDPKYNYVNLEVTVSSGLKVNQFSFKVVGK